MHNQSTNMLLYLVNWGGNFDIGNLEKVLVHYITIVGMDISIIFITMYIFNQCNLVVLRRDRAVR